MPGPAKRALCRLLIAAALFAAPLGPAAAFDLFARHEVTAQFATPDGKPLAGAEVRVYGPGDPGKVVETGHTDAQGKFTFPADRDGFWSAEAHTPTQVARVTIRVGGEQKQPAGRVSPGVMIGALGAIVLIAFGYRVLRARRRRQG